MIKIDLVTGFLGCGKTSFIRKYAQYFVEQGQKVGILENDFGAVNVDMMLLQDMVGEKLDMEMVVGGGDVDCHKRRYKTKLIAMGMTGYDRVIVEPSGIYDVDEFFDVLHEDPINRWFQVGSVIGIIDGKLEKNLSEVSRFFLGSQIAKAGVVLMSKVDAINPEQIQRNIEYVNQALKEIKCNRVLGNDVICKPWEEMEEADFAQIARAEYQGASYVKKWVEQQENYQPVYIMNSHLSPERLKQVVEDIFQDESCGDVIRVKGFTMDGEGWVEINATREEVQLKPIPKGQDVVIAIGANLVEEKIMAKF